VPNTPWLCTEVWVRAVYKIDGWIEPTERSQEVDPILTGTSSPESQHPSAVDLMSVFDSLSEFVSERMRMSHIY
jgi:hypothetical protein